MHGLGAEYLTHSLTILSSQTFGDFEIVISDHSENEDIKNVAAKFRELMEIKYIKNKMKLGNSSANINNAIKNASGQYVKILFQDDYLYGDDSLAILSKNLMQTKPKWLATSTIHTKNGRDYYRPFHPKYDDGTILFKNTLSSPSVLTLKNESPIFFDENLIWYMDCDYYKRCFERFGNPVILDEILVVNRVGTHQISNTLATDKIRRREFKYVLNKFRVKWHSFIYYYYYAMNSARRFKRLILRP